MTLVKICGITNLEDALLSVKFGADMLGFNFYKKSPRYVSAETAKGIIDQLPQDTFKVGVFVNETAERIVEVDKLAGLNAIQLHGEESAEFVAKLKAMTASEVIKAFRVSPDFGPEDVQKCPADAILLDTYSTKERGGTGETFNWDLASELVKRVSHVYLAGGLNPDNIANALLRVKPFAVDVCSGVESRAGIKDKIKLINFIEIVRFSPKMEGGPLDLFTILRIFRSRPKLYFPSKSITQLCSFICGYFSGLEEARSKKKDYHDFFQGFARWLHLEYGSFDVSIFAFARYSLKRTNDDEESAFDLFFALLEEFRLDKGTK